MGSSCQHSNVIKCTPINSISSTSKSTNLLSNRGKDGAKRPSLNQSKAKDKKFSYQCEYFSQEDQIRLMKFNSLPIHRSISELDLSVSKLTEINRGSYGVVYKALSNSGTCFAIKVIEKKKEKTVNTANSVGIMTKETEINLLSKLEHKNIVQYYRYEEYDDRYDIYMEYCEDGTIQDQIMKYKKLDENVIRCYLRHILLGLEYLHFKKVAHRDIKSSNILISKGVCKLCDFGLSKDIWKKKESNGKVNQACSIKGTYYYIAPEIVNQPYNGTLADIDWFYSDIWSLGVTVFQMATGKFPYSENKIYRMMVKPSVKQFEPVDIPVHLSKELRDFIGSCLKIEPHERLTVSQLLKHTFVVGDDAEDLRKEYEDDYEEIVEEEDIGDNQQIFGVNGFMNKKQIISIG